MVLFFFFRTIKGSAATCKPEDNPNYMYTKYNNITAVGKISGDITWLVTGTQCSKKVKHVENRILNIV